MSIINIKYPVNFILSFRDKNKKLPKIDKKFIIKIPNKKKININHNISNPWISSIEKKKKDFCINKKIIEYLNIISINNFDIIVNDFKKIYIKDANCLKNIINIIYEKSISEENYINLYVKLISKIKNIYPNMQQNNKKINFITLLLDNVYTNFMIWNKIDTENVLEKQKTINNILFIGNLFIEKIITLNILNNYFDNLFEYLNIDKYKNFSFELICRLIKIIYENYKSLDCEKLFYYINILQQCANITSKNKFLLMDITEINKNFVKNNIEIYSISDNKIRNIILEYFNNLDLDDITEYYIEYKNKNQEELFYTNLINLYLETNKENKEYLIDFIKHLNKNNYISININNVINFFYNNKSEYIIDFPNFENDINNIKKI